MIESDVPSLPKLKVLIADDFQETRRSIRLMLALNPDVVVVAIAKDGQEAIELAKLHHPDLMVLDIYMPKRNGLEAYKEINQIHPNTGCIIITGQKETELLSDAMSLGAQEYLLKPFSIEDLNGAVNRVAVLIREYRQKLADTKQVNQNNQDHLKQLANEYVKVRRTDDQALAVFEQLANDPTCEIRWLQTLAMLYVIRQEWKKLTALSGRLEHLSARDTE
jgi:YesN/AraC family two-component response regulator